MVLYQELILALIDLCEEFGMEWQWLKDGTGIQIDLTSTDEFSRYRFLKETRKIKQNIFGPF
ncbi:hypothetical protein BBF96_15410 [Anoxybacter fermentans]|uniref:Uncharacterized protein n=1 Tax=Anoxybacter fermentans TaxID=1323375 RepID=A0A3S9T280_9FIRM|nr:hypothetical protein BBF96_15410 [Anoxybacter fermentans]